jgi:hypothetical protein
MRVCGHEIEILRAGTDYHDWRLGIQLALDGQVAPMFDLHKSRIVDVGDNSDAYESLLVESASALLRDMGPQPAGVPAPASPR